LNNSRLAHAKQVRALFGAVGGTKVASHGMFMPFLKENLSISVVIGFPDTLTTLIGFLSNSNRHCN
jgi:hypothetical protein